MRSTRHLYTTILSLLLTFAAPASVRAVIADDEEEDYDVKARVVRISLITGDVSLKRNGNTDWERARINFPLVEGDIVSTNRDSRLEIQVDARNFVRLESNSILRLVNLREEGVALSLVEGTASVRLAKFDRDKEYFEIDAPKVTLAAEKKGLYRIDVTRDGRVRLTARDGGRARIYSETSGFALRDGRTAELIIEGADAGDWQFVVADGRDSWDNWVDNRERYLAQRLRYDTQYYDNYIWGAEDLDAYGSWVYANDYGWIWRPNVTIINNYYDWAPYRYGYWTWCPPYGWTWVGYEPWGWAPYHYGRWVYYNNYWAWCPRSHYYRRHSWWRPALVAFHISFGNNICWYPLSYYHRDPRSRYYHRSDRANDRLIPLRRDELAYLRRVNPAQLRAVSSVAARDFGSDSARARPANDDLARRVVNAEAIRGDLPVRPAGVARGENGDQLTVARPARVSPNVDAPNRQTGAAARTPGEPLDNELRRARVFQGREPVTTAGPAENAAPNSTEARPTGAVTRPARPARIDSADDSQRTLNRGNDPNERPARPNRTFPQPERPATNDTNDQTGQPAPTAAPSRPPTVEQPSMDRPSRPSGVDRPERNDRPERIDRPARPERNDDSPRPERIERPQPRERVETPTSRPDPPSRPEPPARSEAPPQRSEPPPQRSEPSHRYEPPARSEPPPQRSEPARNDPPPRSDPPSRSDPSPSRSDPPPQRSDPPPSRSESAPSRPADAPSRSRP